MTHSTQLIRRAAAALAAAFFVFLAPTVDHAQTPVPTSDRHITYILPHWDRYSSATDSEFTAEVAEVLRRIGEGPRVRVGFTTYVYIQMTDWNVDVSNASAVQAALEPTIQEMDAALARAVANGIPVCLSFGTAIRSRYDASQSASELEDRRNMQWYSDNSLAGGWWTHSQYARKQRRVQEAYIRELGKVVAARMAAYPDTFVAASGDGEVELAYPPSDTSLLADYSPFAVAEFRDWLRQAGLYAPGGALAGKAFASSARYAGDASPAVDSSGDGHTLNIDYGTSFQSWDLLHFDWSLGDPIDGDPHAIPSSQYLAPGWNSQQEAVPYGFDAPRTRNRSDAWWSLWDQFRQAMIWRHNIDFAKWMTTSADPATGYTVPPARWFSDQIPADYLFGHTPADPDFRLDTSASPFWTADVSPYGSLGITSFNTNNGFLARTLAGVAPQIAARRVRWGIFEWNPSVPTTVDLSVYEQEMALVEQYRPSLLVPYRWGDNNQVKDTPFELALYRLVQRIKVIPLGLSRPAVAFSAVSGSATKTPAQTVRVTGAPGELPPWSATSTSAYLTVQKLPDGRTMSIELSDTALAPGSYTGSVIVSSSDPGYSAATLTVTVQVQAPGASSAPAGFIDTPADNAIVSGEVPFTGWAVDDFGVSSVEILRAPLPGEPTEARGLVPVGTATQLDGARPDVLALYPGLPLNYKAGWGFMVLTNMLPNQGNGVFTLYAYANDYDGRTTLLGSKRIDCRNNVATLPFGTIDTPKQGETVSGTVVNFGWALTPSPASIPLDGSTMTVYVDGVPLGHPVYNNYRSDIASLFPGYANSNGAVGYFMLDTTTLANGVHTIEWGIRDSLGRATGVGSRYFTIANP